MHDVIHVEVTEGIDQLAKDVADEGFRERPVIPAHVGNKISQRTARAVLEIIHRTQDTNRRMI